ncbi:MAG: hydantoinase/oxoprolinase family protein, partial [Candidatus Heimdallarchaeota archaeon]
MVRIGVDIGGTFTDFIVLTDTGTILATKVHSTSLELSRAFLKGIKKLLEKEKISSHDVHFLGHGTTICTNALLEGKVPVTGLLTTKGFRDVLEIGRQNRPTLYDLFFDRPEPLVSRRHRREILERINADGTIETPLNQEDVVQEVQFLKEDGITNIAVCYLFSYVNPSHEMETKRLIVKTYPEMDVSISTEIAPIYREYERTATTCANATLRGVMIAYLEALQGLTGGLYEKLVIFDNAGGLMSPEAMKERPVYALLSGPSAGVAATSYLSAKFQEPNMIGFDMGGTSCDVCLLFQGIPEMRRQITVRQPVQIRSIDIETIGAGGGSIAWVDRGGALHVGPRSAGADPGPACYARGGTDPTVTDANLVAGRLGPEGLLGGEYPLDEILAWEALQQIDPDPEKASAAILRLVCTNMAMAVRKVSIERGYDPRDFILCAFGG